MSSGKLLGFAAGLRHAWRNSAGPPMDDLGRVVGRAVIYDDDSASRVSPSHMSGRPVLTPSSGLSTAARRRAMSSAFFAIPDARIRRLRAGKPLGDAFGKSGRGSPVALDTTGGKGFEPPVLPRNDIVFERRGTSTIQLYLEESTAGSRIRGAGRGWHTRAHSRQAPLWDNRRRRRHLRGQLCITRFNSVRTVGQPHAADRLPERASRFAPIKTGSFRIGCDCEPDLICADSGSCDVGPVPLGADISSSPRQSQVDDLEECCSPLMPEIVADSPSSPVITCFCYHLFPGPRIQGSQWLAPDLFFLAGGAVRSEPVGANPVSRPRYLYVN
jgi:hypothetical protein